MKKKYRSLIAILLVFITVFSLGTGVMTVEAGNGSTAISMNRDVGISEVQTVIPDYNFAAAVYDTMYANNHLGNDGQSVKEVLSTFTGQIDANGWKVQQVYTVQAAKKDLSTSLEEDIEELFYTIEEAQDYYDSLIDTSEYSYSYKRIKSSMMQTDELKDEADLIHDISGIEWLRQAQSIDISYNKITDLTPLDINHLVELGEEIGETNVDGAKWFGTTGQNLYIDFRGNPIQKYPAVAGGRLNWPRLESAEFELPVEPYVVIKDAEQNKVFDLNIKIPLIEREGERISLEKNYCSIVNSNIEGVSFDIDNLTKEIAPIKGITYSGNVKVLIVGDDNSRIQSWVVGSADGPSVGSSTLKFLVNQSVRIYNTASVLPSQTDAVITLEKNEADSVMPVEGAKYRLYRADIVDGSYREGDLYSETYYTTDSDGKITIEEELEEGDYCLIEEEAPKHYILDRNPIGFSIGGGTVSLTGGTPEVTPTESGVAETNLNGTYFDRFSPNVSLNIKPDEGYEVKKVVVTYFEQEAQDYRVVEFEGENAGADAENWINANKGNEDELGMIGGSVTVRVIFNKSVNVKAVNQKKPNGGIIVSNTVSGEGASKTKKFDFTVTLDDTSINGTYGEMEFVDGVASFKLKDGESKSAEGLPSDISYVVEESDNEGYVVTSKNETGTIKGNEMISVPFHNYKDVPDTTEEPTVPETPEESETPEEPETPEVPADTQEPETSDRFADINEPESSNKPIDSDESVEPARTTASNEPDTVAKTADETSLVLWFVLFSVSAIGLIFILLAKKQDKKEYMR